MSKSSEINIAEVQRALNTIQRFLDALSIHFGSDSHICPVQNIDVMTDRQRWQLIEQHMRELSEFTRNDIFLWAKSQNLNIRDESISAGLHNRIKSGKIEIIYKCKNAYVMRWK